MTHETGTENRISFILLVDVESTLFCAGFKWNGLQHVDLFIMDLYLGTLHLILCVFPKFFNGRIAPRNVKSFVPFVNYKLFSIHSLEIDKNLDQKYRFSHLQCTLR